MSDPATPAAPAADPAAPAPAPDAPVTSVDIPDDGGFPAPEPEPEPAPEPPKADAPKPDDPKPIKKSAFQTRIDTVTAQRAAADRRAEEAERQRDLYKAMLD